MRLSQLTVVTPQAHNKLPIAIWHDSFEAFHCGFTYHHQLTVDQHLLYNLHPIASAQLLISQSKRHSMNNYQKYYKILFQLFFIKSARIFNGMNRIFTQ